MSAPVAALPSAAPTEATTAERRPHVGHLGHPGHIARRVAGWALVLVLLVLGVLYVLPTRFGGTTSYTVVAGKSMNPTYETGDLLIGRPRSSYEVGDIVIYSVPADQPGAGSGVVHRIVGGDGEAGWVLQGDNNDEVDFWRPVDSDIRSGIALRIPKVGYVLHYAASPLLLTVLGGLVVGWVLWPRDDDQLDDDQSEDDTPDDERDGGPGDAVDTVIDLRDTVVDLRDGVIDLRDDVIVDLRSLESEAPEPHGRAHEPDVTPRVESAGPTRRLVVRFVIRSTQEVM